MSKATRLAVVDSKPSTVDLHTIINIFLSHVGDHLTNATTGPCAINFLIGSVMNYFDNPSRGGRLGSGPEF